LLYLLEVQTSIAGEMLGASTYTQPGVEAGKEATRALMSAEGPIKNPAAKGLPAEAATYAALRKRIEAD
jgi:glucose-6-phosphate isomerase